MSNKAVVASNPFVQAMETTLHWASVADRLPAYGQTVLTLDDQCAVAEARRVRTDAQGEHWQLCWRMWTKRNGSGSTWSTGARCPRSIYP